MNSQVNTAFDEQTVTKRQSSLLSLFILIVVVFVLQLGMKDISEWLGLEGNALKLMVTTRLIVSIFLPTLLFLLIVRLSIRQTLGLYSPPWIKTLLAVVLGFVLILAVNMILPRLLQPSQKLAQESSSIVAYGNIPELLLSFLTVSLLASVTDELFFRGVLLRGIMMRYGKVVAIVLTALLTALFHTLEPFKLAHAFIMGLIFATSVVWTNSVYTSIILHSLHNSLSLLPQG